MPDRGSCSRSSIAGFGCALAGLCYASSPRWCRLRAAPTPYAYATLGELFAWIIGWDLVLEYAVASSTVAHGWSHYFVSFLGIFGVTLPAAWIAAPFDYDTATAAWVVTGTVCNLPAFLVVLLVTIVLVIGIRESANFNAAMVILKLAVVLFVIVVGAGYVETKNWEPVHAVRREGRAQRLRVHLLRLHRLRLGLDAMRRRRRTRSATCRSASSRRSILCTILYILVAACLTGMIPYTQIDVDAPVAHAFKARGPPRRRVPDLARRGRRHHERAARAAALAGARAARDGARRPHPEELLRGRAPALPHAAQGDDPDRVSSSRRSRRSSR
jgi:APA family basic amino acid/polyamine antiporter